jgi:hypothetical protein
MSAVTGRRVGIALTGVVTIFLLFDAVLHVANVEVVRTSMADLGFRANLAPVLGIIELCCIGLYVWRRTELLGAVLLTGYLGGAIASNLRVEKPLLSTVLFPVYVAAAAWGGLYLRDTSVRLIVDAIVGRPGAAPRSSATPAEVPA